MEQERLSEILEQHKLWLQTRFLSETKGMRADLTGANLRSADLTDAYLRDANLRGADLRDADLTDAYLRDADLTDANLRSADLRSADLTHADLTGANLRGADLRDADLTDAYLRDADLTGANLRGADLTHANLTHADLDYSCLPLWCGSLLTNMDDKQVIQLLYHTLSVVKNSNNVSQELKDKLLTETNIAVAREFHRAEECNKL